MQFKRIEGSFPVAYKEVEDLIEKAALEIDVKGDKQGFYDQTLETVANCVFKGSGDFWLIYDGSTAYGYAICSMSRDIDNRLTYWGTQAYAHKNIRAKPIVKELWGAVRQYAKEHGAKHFGIVSSRSTKAYLRYLGKQWHQYAVLLKEDI